MGFLTETGELDHIVVARTDGLAGLIVSLPIATALKSRLPDVEVAYMVPPESAPIAARIPEIDRVLTVSEMRKAIKVLRIYRPDAMIFAHPDLKLAIEAVLTRVDVRIGSGYKWFSGLFTRWVYDHRRKGARHASEHAVNMLTPLFGGSSPIRMPELPVSSSGADEALSRLAEAGVGGDYIVINPGGSSEVKAYDPERYGEVARQLAAIHDDIAIVITSYAEADVAAVIEAAGGSDRIVALGEMSVDALSELFRSARGVIGSSSGLLHLAALVGAPVVGLYPATPPLWPARWRPLGPYVTTLVPQANEAYCPSCERGHHPDACTTRISPMRVVEAASEMLGIMDN